MTDVLLVKPDSGHSVLPPLGLGYLSTALKRQGVACRILHCGKDALDPAAVSRLVKEEQIPIVGITAFSIDHVWLVEFADLMQETPDVRLVIGGPHASGLRERLMQLIPRIDFVSVTEGELSFPPLARTLLNGGPSDDELASMPNLVWRDSTGELRENSWSTIPDLDTLGFPDWDEMPPADYSGFAPHGGFSKATPVAQLMTTRGCPYGCRYCSAGMLHGKKIRRRGTDSILDEIDLLKNKYGVREFHLEDDNFTFYKDHVVDLCTGIRKRGLNAHYALPNGVRLDRLDREILQEMASAGFYTFSIGFESGSQETLKRMGKALDLGIVDRSMSLLREFDFQLKGFFMIGYLGETRETILETIEFARSLDLDRAYFSMYIPLPGTADFAALEEQGKIDLNQIEWEKYHTKGRNTPPFVPDEMTLEEMEYLAHIAYRRFYLRPKIMFKMLRDLKIRSPRQFGEVAWNLATGNLSYFI